MSNEEKALVKKEPATPVVVKGKNVNGNKKPNIFKRLGRLFKEVISELKKVTWPKGKTVTAQTGVVLLVVFFFFVTLLLIDSGLLYLYNLLVGA